MSERKIVNLNLEKDFDSFDELCILSFGERTNQDLRMHKWMFDENPYNPNGHNLMYVLKDGDKIIGADGLIPFKLYVDGKTVVGAHSVKSMTHPDFKRQGIFRMMTENSVNSGRENGVDVIIGLANKNSYPAYERFGWPTLFEKDVFVRPINIKHKLKNKVKADFIASFGNATYKLLDKMRLAPKNALKKLNAHVSEYDKVPKFISEYFEKYKDKYGVLIVRDYKYLNYRYNKRPDVTYKTLIIESNDEKIGFVILRETSANGSKMVSVAENFTDPTNELFIGAIAQAIIEYCYKIDAEYVVVGTGLYGKFKDVLPKYGFNKNKKRLINNMMIANALTDKITIDELMGHERWHITQGDGETELDL
ncbi:GNAT family N-acetyltransferase [Sedimentibacter sp. zth1]|uniref:GNAT family N-acetyltransferase n=1 Tax=Sedimentibacter sp. zth1 TaxID=2816908 RepID=UPI001A91FB1C|nr:GNAT family N-acetyltransferase [Sedimentibacter sp. zth1]QSX05408.1 GNAT family N-acetyltransferase [Sedimentibacter sp. zth1]